ncbi:uncharacterized protein LAESUDRAFT_110446 [Laetiporus sulphureus 93-53]|uniref:Secreted protein n=1 Tax=Laetiporus sulphureus 93-53 TaxID=1314785 RepID=A0A165ENX6_9APHY|nr:uncharacterized protein LAESUDRAFT_110446 [Laetiporus sulphureus 93-53]KZT07456.1 hypothetical protein LAESUDRAFT_110446 [Laetiporus sulphureus 93-53]
MRRRARYHCFFLLSHALILVGDHETGNCIDIEEDRGRVTLQATEDILVEHGSCSLLKLAQLSQNRKSVTEASGLRNVAIPLLKMCCRVATSYRHTSLSLSKNVKKCEQSTFLQTRHVAVGQVGQAGHT